MRREGLARDRRVLDVFTGSGALAIAAANAGAAEVSAIDLSRRAALNARLNSVLNRARVRVLRGDLFEPVRGERFDLILANPPYLPGESDRLPKSGAARAWEGGADGRLLVDRLCREAPAHLRPGGTLLMTHSEFTGVEETQRALAGAGLYPEVAAREKGPLGPLMAARADLLERRGLLAPGAREEEILVFRAAAPTREGAVLAPAIAR
jgi:release factor glutamine methyltransferase